MYTSSQEEIKNYTNFCHKKLGKVRAFGGPCSNIENVMNIQSHCEDFVHYPTRLKRVNSDSSSISELINSNGQKEQLSLATARKDLNQILVELHRT